MGLLFFIIFIMFIFNGVSVKLIQVIFQNLIFLITFYFMLKYPLCSKGFNLMYYFMGVDSYSLGLILLTLWIFSLMILVSLKDLMSLKNIYYLNILNFMLLMLILCFMSMNLILFYLFFEASLIPVFMLILGWGFQVDRIQAGYYMMLYTLFGSMPLFMIIMFIYKVNYSLIMCFIELIDMNFYVYYCLMVAFLIKMPMYLVHLWLPKAHVEAPLVGSMILAGVMLKLGGYGVMRVILMMLSVSISFNKIVMVIGLMGGVYSSLVCLCQVDMKMLVAYSSVVHMSMFIGGILTIYNLSYLAGILMMISHGLCSSGLFSLVNISYERFNSRSLLLNKGMINLIPSLSLIWFLLCSSNMSFPPSLNLWSEIMFLNCLISWSTDLGGLLVIILFLGASYSLYLYSFSQHGMISGFIYLMKGVNVNEFLNLLLHWGPLNIMFMYISIYV